MKNLESFKSFKNSLQEVASYIGPFVFSDDTDTEKLKELYDEALTGYANHSRGMRHPKSAYKKAYQAIEKILKKRGVVVENAQADTKALNEYTDFDFTGREVLRGLTRLTPEGKKILKKAFPLGWKSQVPAELALKAHDKSETKLKRGAPMFVHVQYGKFTMDGTKYVVHQDQFYNGNFRQDKDFSPEVTVLSLSNDETGKKLGEIVVKTDDYVKDLNKLSGYSQG